jgi:hypothetical protein
MTAKYTLTAAAAVLLLVPATLRAGGLPRLCLPVDGVTADNAGACARRLADALGSRAEKVELRENTKQWYAMFQFNGEPVTLGELDVGLKGSPFTIPREHLRLFGHVMLEVQIGESSVPKLLADLKAVKHLTVSESKREGSVQYVTVAMPYPRYSGGETADFGKLPFEKEQFGAVAFDDAPKVDPPAAARDLPTYDSLRAAVEKHGGTLKGIRWNCWACRVLGGVAVPISPQKRE